MKKIMYILVITATLGVSFMVTGGLVWLICWAFFINILMENNAWRMGCVVYFKPNIF